LTLFIEAVIGRFEHVMYLDLEEYRYSPTLDFLFGG
jgi:hypothetical protein